MLAILDHARISVEVDRLSLLAPGTSLAIEFIHTFYEINPAHSADLELLLKMYRAVFRSANVRQQVMPPDPEDSGKLGLLFLSAILVGIGQLDGDTEMIHGIGLKGEYEASVAEKYRMLTQRDDATYLRAIDSENENCLVPTEELSQPMITSQGEHWYVKRILDSRWPKLQMDSLEFRVQWYSDEQPPCVTWEPAANLDCDLEIVRYFRENPDAVGWTWASKR